MNQINQMGTSQTYQRSQKRPRLQNFDLNEPNGHFTNIKKQSRKKRKKKKPNL